MDSCFYKVYEVRCSHEGGPPIAISREANRGYQCVYKDNGLLETDPEFAGTFDFYPPRENLYGHFLKYVLPWFIWGN